MNIFKVNVLQRTSKIIKLAFHQKSIILNQSNNHNFCSQKYRKAQFDWQPASNKRQNSSYSQNSQNYQKRKEPLFHTRQNSRTERPTFIPNRQDKTGQERQIKFYANSLNPNMSLLSQYICYNIRIMYKKTVSDFCGFYEHNKEFFNPRILVNSARQFCILIDKQRNSPSFNSALTISIAKKFINEIIALEPKLKTEEITGEETKNLLFFIKKLQFDFAKVLHMEKGSQYFDEELFKKVTKFRNQLLFLFLDHSYDYKDYEIHELVEIFYELVRFSQVFEVENLYKYILEREKILQETVNSQYLFSATHFILTVKNIEFNVERGVERKNSDENEEKVSWARTYLEKKSREEVKRTKILRQRCYEIFFKKWMYYFSDMSDYISLNDVMKIWPGVILSNSGPKMLLKDTNGPKVLKTLDKILKNNGSKFEEMIKIHPRVLANSIVALHVISKRYSSDKLSQELDQRGKVLIDSFQAEEKKRVKIRAKYAATLLKQEQIINVEEERQIIGYLNNLY